MHDEEFATNCSYLLVARTILYSFYDMEYVVLTVKGCYHHNYHHCNSTTYIIYKHLIFIVYLHS